VLIALLPLALACFGLGAVAPAALGQAMPALVAAEPVLVDPYLEAQAGAPPVAFQQFIRTELFFGTNKPGGSKVTEAEWEHFLDTVITPKFPDGLTVLTGYGQFRNSSGVIVQEDTKLLILLYPADWRTRTTSSANIEAIRAAYKEQFQQESVLRTDDPLAVRTSF
jgi:hypothetical protein